MMTPLLFRLFLLAAMVLAVGACAASGTSADAPLAVYERIWPDGLIEQTTVHADGRVLMKHGDHLERFNLPATDVERLRAALSGSIPTGSADDVPKRSLTLADGSVIAAPRPDPGSVTELLDRLTDTHGLGH